MSEEETKDVAAEATEAPAEAVAPAEEAAPAETPAETTDAPADDSTDVEVPAKFAALVEQVESMSVLELNELVKLLEKKFGVSAVAMAAPAAGGDAGAEEKDDFIVHLADAGASKIGVIKAVKTVLNLGLKEAKDLVDSAPADLKSGVKKEEAEAMKADIEAAGGKVELK